MPGSVKALRLHNLILGGGLTAAQLETELNNARAAGAFDASLKQRTVVTALKASSGGLNIVAGSAKAVAAIQRQDASVLAAICADTTAIALLQGATWTTIAASASMMAAIIASATGMVNVAANATAMAAIAASATAMAAIVVSTPAINTLVASNTAMTAVGGNTVSKMALYNSDAFLNAVAASATAMTALRAAAQYSVKSAIENSTNSVALAWTGNAYIVLGYSRNTTSSRTATLSTLRSGSAISPVPASLGVSSTIAQDVNCAIPVTSAYSFVLGGAGSTNSYFGALRCDI